MSVTHENIAELIGLTVASFPGSKGMSKEEIIWHLEIPVCKILTGVKAHVTAMGYIQAWRLCFALKCGSLEELIAVMWDMIKKRKRKDSTWQNYLPAIRDGS